MVVLVWKETGKKQTEGMRCQPPGSSLLRPEVLRVAEFPDILLRHSLGLPLPDPLPELPEPLSKPLSPLLVSPVPVSSPPLSSTAESSELEIFSH